MVMSKTIGRRGPSRLGRDRPNVKRDFGALRQVSRHRSSHHRNLNLRFVTAVMIDATLQRCDSRRNRIAANISNNATARASVHGRRVGPVVTYELHANF
jgi:hypothetical protein